MGATPARQFPPPGSYAMQDQNVVAPQDPTPIIPQQQYSSTDSPTSGAPVGPVNPKIPVNPAIGQRFMWGGGFRKDPMAKFFGDY